MGFQPRKVRRMLRFWREEEKYEKSNAKDNRDRFLIVTKGVTNIEKYVID